MSALGDLNGIGKVTQAVLIALAWISWILTLAGVSALEAVCNSGCRTAYGLAWWIIWLQFLLLIFVIPIELMSMFGGFAKTALLIMFGYVTVISTILSDRYLSAEDASGQNSSRLRATIAGFIMTTIFDLLIIFVGGTLTWESPTNSSDNVGVATYPSKSRPTSPTGPATANGAPPTTPSVPPQSNFYQSRPGTAAGPGSNV